MNHQQRRRSAAQRRSLSRRVALFRRNRISERLQNRAIRIRGNLQFKINTHAALRLCVFNAIFLMVHFD